MSDERSGPLAGITVVEVGVFLAVPFATMHLADLGARVIKVEPPGRGDPVRAIGPFLHGESSPFLRVNRNKESVSLDLKTSGGREAFLRLLATADALVENLRPGAMRGLGLGYEDLAPLFPGLVYGSASGWGQDGQLSSLPGLDIMAQARSGLMSITGEADADPVKVGVPVCDLVCGLYMALGTVAALREREHSGKGQFLDVSLMESAVSLAVWEAGRYFATGDVPGRLGSAHQASAPYQAVRTMDGYVTLGATTPRTWNALCLTLGLETLEHDPRYTTGFSRHTHRDSLIPAVESVTRRRSTDELVDGLQTAGVPCAPIRDFGQVFNDTHLEERDYFWDAESPQSGPIRQLGSPMRLSRTAPVRGAAGPGLGQHTRNVLGEVGLSQSQITDLIESGGAA